MICLMCKHGETQPGLVTVTLQRDDTVVVFKQVPADVCDNCGEYYLSETITERLLTQAEAAVQRGAEIEILRYAA